MLVKSSSTVGLIFRYMRIKKKMVSFFPCPKSTILLTSLHFTLPPLLSVKLCIGYIVLSRFYRPEGGCRILVKHGIRKFIVSAVAVVCKPFRERVTRNQIN